MFPAITFEEKQVIILADSDGKVRISSEDMENIANLVVKKFVALLSQEEETYEKEDGE